ncbi:MAG TPA: hypothetical protein VG101_21110 [Puia sp.]|nr:hypothetical protein [Puia sp.]
MGILPKAEIQRLPKGNVSLVHVGFSLSLVATEVIRSLMQMLHAIFKVMHSFSDVGVLGFLGPHQLELIGSRWPVPDNNVNADHRTLGKAHRRYQQQNGERED